MEHNEAMEKMMAERYLLGELLEEDRDAFEEHFFGCTECAAAVRSGAAMLDSGREIAREQRSVSAVKSRRTAWLPAAAAVAITVLGYQGYVIPRYAARVAEAEAPRVVQPPLAVVASTSRSETAPMPVLSAAAGQALPLSLELDLNSEFVGYRSTIVGAPGLAGRPVVISAEEARRGEVEVYVPTGLDAGSYELRIEGQPRQGSPVAIATYRLDVH